MTTFNSLSSPHTWFQASWCVTARKWKLLSVCDSLRPHGLYIAHGILQARILEWVAVSFSRGASWPRNQTRVSCIAGGFFTIWATREAFWKRLGPVCMSRLEKQSVVSVAAIPQICAKQPPMIKSKWKFNLPFQKAHYLSLSNSTKNNNNNKK